MLCNSYAQQNIYFINKAKNKIIEVRLGHQLSLKYNGYLGQSEFVKQTVTDISDSFVVLGINPEILGKTFEKAVSNSPKYIYKKILLKDIISFRRMTSGRELLKSTLMLANIFSTVYILTDLYKKNNFTSLETIGISMGVGIVSSTIINIAFPENPKYEIEDGWTVTTGFRKPNL